MRIVERVAEHYEAQEVEYGRVYRWCPESVVIECEVCAKNPILTYSKNACGECGADHGALVEEVLDERPEHKVDHPWRLLRPYHTPTKGA